MKKIKTFQDLCDLWDAGEFFYTDVEEALMNIPDGEKLGNIMKDMTVCPVHNATCETMMRITVWGINPDKGHHKQIIDICPLGVSGWGEKCPLNK